MSGNSDRFGALAIAARSEPEQALAYIDKIDDMATFLREHGCPIAAEKTAELASNLARCLPYVRKLEQIWTTADRVICGDDGPDHLLEDEEMLRYQQRTIEGT